MRVFEPNGIVTDRPETVSVGEAVAAVAALAAARPDVIVHKVTRTTEGRGSSDANWSPRRPSWRQGFREDLG
ncbi:hypothetical protein AB0H86_01150 [Streptomyces sp. NPDC050997]|uniref:hypothetical protein n=1 Tax=Streptomyces sp. NPDC050997 TaxID=3155519 RepID=UPI00343B8517